MRVFPCCALAMSIACLALTPAKSGEIFICNDGRTIELTPANRAKYKNDPCVADWFKNQKSAVEAEAAKTKEPPKSMKGIPAHCKKPWDCPQLMWRE